MQQLHWTLSLATLAAAFTFCPVPSAAQAEEAQPGDEQTVPLHQRIDAIVESAAVGPLAPQCSDHEFVRRICLDLTGAVPTATQVREFVSDTSPTKRQTLIDQLLSSPEFCRHMAVQWDVLLLERRTDAHVSKEQWEAYLFHSLAAGKPLDQLFRELIAADRIAPDSRPALKFVFNREAEPNAVTRDIGRLMFGMDLQCAQCHDHPLIDDYYQEDYYGLFAFVHRTSLLVIAKNKQATLSEKADGEAGFTSVFTGNSLDAARPRLPKGRRLWVEPTLAKEEQYKTKPEKAVAGVPKHSRREALADMLADSRVFQRNLANRLWAMVFGRGIVHPLDFHYAANPPTNPELLDLLADELVREEFQLRSLLRQLVLTRAYQRVCDAPQVETVNFADIAARGERLRRELDAAIAAMEPRKAAFAASEAAFSGALDANRALDDRLPELEKAALAAKQALETALAAEKAVDEERGKLEEQSRLLLAARTATDAAVVGRPDDQELADAAKVISAKAEGLAGAVEAAQAKAKQHAAEAEAARRAAAESAKAVTDARAARVGPEKLAELEQSQLAAERQLRSAEARQHAIEFQVEICETAGKYAALAKVDPTAAETAWRSLVQQWTIAGQIAPLRPLTPEQLAISAMRATGMLLPQIAAVEAKLDKSPPKTLTDAGEADRQRIRDQLVQLELIDQTRGTVAQFVAQYGGLPGEDFQATANQALFFGNSPVVEGWLRPAGDNLAARLAAVDAAAVADELYVSVLSRPAEPAEQREVAALLSDASEQPAEAIAQLIWALLSSTEFRFNH